MKTIREIENWLEKQEWFDQFSENRQADLQYREFFEEGLNEDERRARIVSNAFDWNHTPEGYEFWEKINKAYLMWLADGDFMEVASIISPFN